MMVGWWEYGKKTVFSGLRAFRVGDEEARVHGSICSHLVEYIMTVQRAWKTIRENAEAMTSTEMSRNNKCWNTVW